MKYLYLLILVSMINTTALSQQKIMNGNYVLISAQSEKVLEYSGGDELYLGPYTGDAVQEFKIVFNDEGIFNISRNSKNVVKNRIKNENRKDKKNNVVFTEKQFVLEPVTDSDLFMIVEVNSSRVLSVDLKNSDKAILIEKSKVIGKNASKKYWRIAQRVSLKNKRIEKLLSVKKEGNDDSGKIVIMEGGECDNFAFDLIPMVNSNRYLIRSAATKKYITIDLDESSKTGMVLQEDFNGGERQQFLLKEVQAFTYKIVNGKKLFLTPLNKKNNEVDEVKFTESANSNESWELSKYKKSFRRYEENHTNERW